MPLTVRLTDKPGVAVYQEFDKPAGAGDKVPPLGTIAYVSSDPAVATVDATTGQLAYLGAGVTTISGSDGGNLPASDTLTIIGTPVSSTLTLEAGV